MIERVKLLEYEAKQILTDGGIATPKSYITAEKPSFLPVVIKSQVPTGGRGKAGGVVVVRNTEEYYNAIETMPAISIKGFTPKTLLAEELITIDRELYLSLLIDKKAATIALIAHANGGVEVEENPIDTYFTRPLSPQTDFGVLGQELADYYDLPGQTFALQDLVEKLYKTFIRQDALLLEINPLILSRQDVLVVGDCKMECDDAAAFRHPEWQFETEKSEVNFVTLDPRGTIATVANGAGLAMATVDAVADAGLKPANFLDIGGGANEASILAAFKRIMEYENIQAIIINIFAGITRCDEVAKAIVTARAQLHDLPPLAVRLAGTNYKQAAYILEKEDVAIEASLADAIVAAKELV